MTEKSLNDILTKETEYIGIINWAVNPPKTPNITTKSNAKLLKKANADEKAWGNKITRQNTCQWTTKLSQDLVEFILIRKGRKVWKPKNINGYCPDLETNEFIYEVKCRNWTTSGTIGEKVFGAPYKYSDVPRLYNKPLKIICVAYQEYEFTHGKNKIFSDDISPEKKNILNFWKNMNIEFMPFSQLLKIT